MFTFIIILYLVLHILQSSGISIIEVDCKLFGNSQYPMIYFFHLMCRLCVLLIHFRSGIEKKLLSNQNQVSHDYNFKINIDNTNPHKTYKWSLIKCLLFIFQNVLF